MGYGKKGIVQSFFMSFYRVMLYSAHSRPTLQSARAVSWSIRLSFKAIEFVWKGKMELCAISSKGFSCPFKAPPFYS
jgi:hypothetical protein